jgi:hypothetical protein
VLAIAPSGAYYDVAEACKSGKINKWSFKKPIRFAQFPELTDAQIMSVNCGLTPNNLSLLRRNCNGLNGVTGGDDSKADILAEVSEWNYLQPNEYYRLTDFDGYNHGALPSDKDWEDYSFQKSDLTAIENSDASVANMSGVNFTIDKSLKILTKFAMKITDGTGNYIGNANDDMLPLAYAAKGGVVSGEGWRIAYAVEIGSEWFLFIGRKPLDASLSVTDTRNYCPPDMSSNTSAVKQLIAKVNSGIKTFTMIPCLVKNATMAFEANQSYPDRKISRVQVNADTLIYAMPSGAQSVRLSVTTSGTMPQIGNIIAVKASDNNADNYTWLLGYVEVQVNPDGSTVYAMVVARKAAITGAVTANLKLRYKTTASGSGYVQIPSSGSGTATYNIASGATFSFKGVTYNGIVIATAVGLNFNEDDVTTFTVQ